jgi:ribosomal protein S19
MPEVCSCKGKMAADAVVPEFLLILLEIETGKKFWRIIIKQELT